LNAALVKADKSAIKVLEKNLKEEEAFAIRLEKAVGE
jgi:ferritin-like metal-binding protein YciE